MGPLLEIDRELFIFINNRMSSHEFDVVMPIITDLHKQPIFWFLVAAIMIYAIFRPANRNGKNVPLLNRDLRKSRLKKWAHGLLIVALSMGLSDFVAYRAVKIWVQRDRPEAAGVSTILRVPSHSGWAFPSNHAANNFALARTVQILAPQFAIPAYLFASAVGFSRVYVGVHYPMDVIGGGFIGFLCASLINWIVAFGFRRFRSGEYSSHART